MGVRRGIWAGLAVCVIAGCLAATALAGLGPDPVIKRWPSWPYEATCGGAPPADPVEVFSRPANAERGSTPAEQALRRFLRDPVIGWVPRHRYRVLWEGKREAGFVSSGLSSDPRTAPEFLVFSRRAKGWRFAASGGCLLRSIVQGHTAIGWDLAESQDLASNTTSIEIHLGPGECASGRSQNDRAHPVWGEIEGKLTLAVWLTPVHGGQTCEGLIEPPLKVRLPSSLGDREIYDAGTYPPHRARGDSRNY